MIVVSYTHPFLRFPKEQVETIMRPVFRGERVRNFPDISVVFTDDKYIRTLNKKYLKHNYSTDVLSFPLSDDFCKCAEVYINLDAGRRQAREYGVPFLREVQRLLIHGALHLLGYEDGTNIERARMREREDYYLVKLIAK